MSQGIYAPGVSNSHAIGGKTINGQNALFVSIIGSVSASAVTAARAAAILTNGYVASAAIDVSTSNQVIFFINFTKGSLTDADVKVEFSPDGTNWYQETLAALSGDTSTETLGIHTYSADGAYRLPIEVAEKYIRISAIGNGTVTGSSMTIKMIQK